MKILHEGKAVIMGVDNFFSLNDFPNLKVIGCPMTSTEHLPWEEINKRGIKVISLQGETEFLKNITSTAEHTIGLVISLLRNYKSALNAPYKDREEYKGHTLRGKTLGIIGFGRIGKQILEVARSFGIHVVIFEPNMDYNTADWALNIESLCASSDIISIHIPLSRNEGFFTKEMFQQMKKDSWFINTSRSKVVEDGALLRALEHGIIKGAAVDFIDDPELCKYAKTHDNLILTNHIGGVTWEDREKTEAFIINKVEEFLNNEKNL
jgi:D-3-phosphoglycerate dehydrogenase